MILKVFTVYDSKAQAYLQPFFMQSAGQAIRAWEDTSNNPETQFSRHPADFTLFEVGTYDDQVGRFENLNAPVALGTALQLKKQPTSAAPLLDRIGGQKVGA